jgi:hypothetical protein
VTALARERFPRPDCQVIVRAGSHQEIRQIVESIRFD